VIYFDYAKSARLAPDLVDFSVFIPQWELMIARGYPLLMAFDPRQFGQDKGMDMLQSQLFWR